MGNMRDQFESKLLDEIGGEALEGSGFEEEISDPSFDTNRQSENDKPSRIKEERHAQ